MSVIDVFWEFMQKYHPQLVNNDWLVDSQLVKSKDIINPEMRKIIPLDMLEVNLILFYYDGNSKDIVFLFQNNKGKQNIAIGLLSDDEFLNAFKL
ncbi:hypothetical protein [Virgibacillus sp. SK37]|uniref:hypothetical protein n=1 Tax=Virgibacillus sp. SK37 TaxID=403957 RepID=UPI0011A887F2|nr:hypothetical protein [Virgibacillus sp. SK37]